MPEQRRWRSFFLAVCLLAAMCAGLCAVMQSETALRLAEAPGKNVEKKKGMVVDLSNIGEGYVMVKSSGDRDRLKLRVEKDDNTYTYDLRNDGEYEAYPLQMGSGAYKITLYEQVSGSKYRQLSGLTLKATLESDEIPYLYPNQYVWYDADTEAVEKSQEICEGAKTDKEKAERVREYVTGHIVYDYILALTVEKGYLPDLDRVMDEGMGVCFDFAALFACMLRAQDVPTRLVIGYADDTYHAWNDVLLGGEWVRYDTTSEVTGYQVKEYTEERRY